MGKNLLRHRRYLLATAMTLAFSLQGCIATKVATTAVSVPAKAVWHGGKMAGKTVYYTGKGAYNVSQQAGKSAYYVGAAPVQFTDAALDTTYRFLIITTQIVDLTGNVLVLTKTVPSTTIDAELRALNQALKAAETVREILSVTVDIAEETKQLNAQFDGNPYN